MTTIHDDYPHPVPPIAQLRWKENYFFIIMGVEQNVHGIVHLNFEPGHDRARFSCDLSVRGQQQKYVNETKFPVEFSMARAVGDGTIALKFLEPHARFNLTLATTGFAFDLTFTKARPTFDFGACRFAAPELPSFQEVMTLGMNLPYNHQQQAMNISGTVKTRESGELRISGLGYRDHSWCMRTDGAVASHTWSALHFGNRAFGVKKLQTLSRPGLWAKEGYVSDDAGERVLRVIEVTYEGQAADGLPQRVRYDLADVLGGKYTIVADVQGRHAQVPLIAEKPGPQGAYNITENFCPCVLQETGDKGCALVEIGAGTKQVTA
ncbi:MAG: hypothetical protein ABW110_10675 [Steroidobacteraceae bacterium]